MRKPPIFLDKPIAGAMIRQSDRQTALSLSIFAAQNFITHQQGALRPWICSTDVVRFFACAERAEGR